MILSVLVWPKPPFQPWTATTAEPGVMIFKANALRRPKRIRLSTYDSSYQDKNVQRRKGAYIRLPLMVLNTSWLRVPEWVASTMQVDLARSLLVSGHCKLVSSPQPTEKRQRTGENGTLGLYLEINLAVSPLVDNTKSALAPCSFAAATAAMATVSAVCVGRAGWSGGHRIKEGSR